MEDTPNPQNYSVVKDSETVDAVKNQPRYEHFEDDGELTIFDTESIGDQITSSVWIDLERAR